MAEPMLQEKYIGLALAMASSLGIGISSIITKKGLIQVEKKYGYHGEGFAYLKSPLWWLGTTTLALGEFCNFAAYAFAPAILVTPLGGLSVLVSAVLGSYFLGEELGRIGKLGSALCLIGAVVVILHAPPDEDITSIDKIVDYALHPGFLIYALALGVFVLVLIFRLAPLHGKRNPLIYISICSIVGSLSVMAIKAFGIAVKLTFEGNNQFFHASTYVFMSITVLCIFVQLNYLNKALSQFPTNIVNPLYFLTFTTGTICASLVFYGGFNTTNGVSIVSLLCGFLVSFTGVALLNHSRSDPTGMGSVLGTQSRNSVQGETMWQSSFILEEILPSRDELRRLSSQITGSGDQEGLMRAYNEESVDSEANDTSQEHGDHTITDRGKGYRHGSPVE